MLRAVLQANAAGCAGREKPGRARHIARRAPASSLNDAEVYSEALKTGVPRCAHGVRVGDQLIEAQVGDVDDLAEREASLAGGGVLDAAPARGQQVLAVHHVVHADDQRAAKLLSVRGGQGAHLLGLFGGHLTHGQ